MDDLIQLDQVAINPDLLTTELSEQDKISYQQQYNLSLVTINSENRINTLLSYLYQSAITATPITFEQINYTLEANLLYLLSATTISSIDNTTLSPHYSRSKYTNPNYLILPSIPFMQELLYTTNETWGGRYGSLLYFNYIQENKDTLFSSSGMTVGLVTYLIDTLRDTTLSYILDYTSNRPYDSNPIDPDTVRSFCLDYNNLLLDDNEESDVLLYNKSWTILGEFNLLGTYNYLDFLSTWIPSVIDYYLTPVKTSQPAPTYSPNTWEYDADQLLKSIARACIQYIDDSVVLNLGNNFIHQSIPSLYYNLIETIVDHRRQTSLSQNLPQPPGNTTSGNGVARLYDLTNAFLSLSINIPSFDMRDRSIYLLNNFCTPGGFNMYLVANALALINRAYILSAKNNNIYWSFQTNPVRDNFGGFTALLGRVRKLMYLAGLSLLKTNLDHLIIVGQNMINMSAISFPSSTIEDLRL